MYSIFLKQALFKDIKQRLLTQMKELLKKGIKVQTIHAWGWFIRLLGSHAMKNRHLINEMLKIPEHTFSDLNPQVLIATQVLLIELACVETRSPHDIISQNNSLFTGFINRNPELDGAFIHLFSSILLQKRLS